MQEQDAERKLLAILHADVAGYSRLMAEDDEGTTRTLAAHRRVIDSLISAHKGRIASTAGDSVLAEFASPVEAMRCALEIQEILRARNAGLSDRKQMHFRIGVNLGDVIVKGGDLFGDGVNIAARIQTLAPPGGICFSGAVHDQIEGKLDLSFESMGDQTVKNIPRPVRTYRIVYPSSERIEGGSVEGSAGRGPRPKRRQFWIGVSIGVTVLLAVIAALAVWSWPKWKGRRIEEALPRPLPPIGANLPNQNAFAFSPDGKNLVSAGTDKSLRIWELATGRELKSMVGHTDEVNDVAFSPDGGRLVSASDDKTLRMWNVDTGATDGILSGHTAPVTSVAYSPDGRMILSGSEDNTVRVWSAETGQELRTLRGHSGWVEAVAISPDSRFFLSGARDKIIKLWDATTGKEPRSLIGHSNYVTQVTFSQDGRSAVSASEDGSVKLWDIATGASLRSFDCGSKGCAAAAFSADDRKILAVSNDSVVFSWDTATGERLFEFRASSNNLWAAAFSPDGQFAALCVEDKVIHLLKVGEPSANPHH